jgi:hypothetical protein
MEYARYKRKLSYARAYHNGKSGRRFYSCYWIDYLTYNEILRNAFVIPIEGINYLIGSGVYYPN